MVLVGASLADAERRADELRPRLYRAGSEERGGPPLVTVSAGCAAIEGQDDVGVARLLAAADVGLSLAKRAGRNRVVSAGL